jgi:tetratricopeptide (TPR) repeat protein
MKSERKQIQESNLLADKIEAQFVKVKQHLPAIIAVVIGVVLALLAYGIYGAIKQTKDAKAWTALYFADSESTELTSISNDFKGTSAAGWAQQMAGDSYMAKATERVYVDRDLADQFYKQALAEYKTVAESTSDSLLKERSLYGQAQAAEGLGDKDQAITCYRRVTAIQGLAPELLASLNQRINWLESKAGQQFYDWYTTNRKVGPALPSSSSVKLPLPAAPDFGFTNLVPNEEAVGMPTTPEATVRPEATAPVVPEVTLPPATVPPATVPPATEVPATVGPASSPPATEPSAEPKLP